MITQHSLLAVTGCTAVDVGRFWDALSSPHWGSRPTDCHCAMQHAGLYGMQYACISTVHASFVRETLLYVVRWPYNTDTYVGSNLTLQTWLLVYIPNSLGPWLLEKWKCLGMRLHSNHL